MARLEGAKRITALGKASALTGFAAMLLSLVIFLIATRISPIADLPWQAINATHLQLRYLGILALAIGAVFWIVGWVVEGFKRE